MDTQPNSLLYSEPSAPPPPRTSQAILYLYEDLAASSEVKHDNSLTSSGHIASSLEARNVVSS